MGNPQSGTAGKIERITHASGIGSIVAALYNFDTDSAELKTEHVNFLRANVVPLLLDPYTRVFVTGSASRIGGKPHNRELSERRLESVAEYLRKNGASDYQLTTEAVGEAHAFGPDANNERHRAVMMYVTRKKKRRKATVEPQKPVTRKSTREHPMHVASEGPQFQLAVRTYIPFKSFVAAEGDGRGVSTSPHDTYRTGMFLVFDLGDGKITQPLTGNSTGSRWAKEDALIFAKVSTSLSNVEGDRGRITFSAHMEGSDPLAYINITPNVDTDIHFTAFMRDGDVQIAGEVIGDKFPNTEVFVRDHTGQAYLLSHYETTQGIDGAIRLYGEGYGKLGSFRKSIQLDQKNRFIGSRRW